MRKYPAVAIVAAAALLGYPAFIGSPALAREPHRPITNRDPDAMDVAKTPITDLNISRTDVPALLVEAQERPYSVQNLDTCEQLANAQDELNLVLGPDLDLPQAERARFSKGRIAQWVVGTFIPFRSLIREVSGANRQEREIRAAIQAGLARRGFLKGVGLSRGCPYPAPPPTEAIVAQHTAALAKDEPPVEEDPAAKAYIRPDPAVAATPTRSAPAFTSRPIVQPTP